MSNQNKVNHLLEKYGETFAEEIGIKLENSPSSLFQLFVTANLFSARISSSISVEAAKALFKEGLTSAEKMKNTTWSERVKILNSANYTRYQERTSTFLGEISEKMDKKYNGDLRKLREEANKDPKEIREKLKDFKGMGDVAVDIFYRDAQQIWPELYPFIDKKTKKAAKKFGIKSSAEALESFVTQKDLARLSAALVRMDLNNDYQLDKDLDPDNGEAEDFKRLMKKSKEELYQEAQEKSIPGRSNMNKKELAEAIH